jgi:hypothetical protein
LNSKKVEEEKWDTSTSTSSSTSSWWDTSTGGWWPWEEETYVDDYEDNNWEYDTWWGNYVPIKVFSVKTRSPIQPEPATCPSGYSELWINSNIFDITTLNLPYISWSNNIALTNEVVRLGTSDYYYKVFNVNGVKIGWVIYKIVNPDFDYYWSFTMCLDN